MSRIKYFETITNSRGDSLANYRVQVVDSTGAIVTIYQDEAGTRFQDAAGNVVNFTLAGPAGKAEFWWEPASGQILQVLDAAGNLVDATDGFANKYVLTNLPGNIATAVVNGLDDTLAEKVAAADLADTGGAGTVGAIQAGAGAVAETVEQVLRRSVWAESFGLSPANTPAQNAAAILAAVAALRTNATTLSTDGLGGASFTAYSSGELLIGPGTFPIAPDVLQFTQDLGLIIRGKGSRRSNNSIRGRTILKFVGASTGFGLQMKANGARGLTLQDLDVVYQDNTFAGDLVDVYSTPGVVIERCYIGTDGTSAPTRLMTARSCIRSTYDEFLSVRDVVMNGAVDGVWSDDTREPSSGFSDFGGAGAVFTNVVAYDVANNGFRHDGNRTRQGLTLIGCYYNPIQVSGQRGVKFDNIDGLAMKGCGFAGSTTHFASIEWLRVVNCSGVIQSSYFNDLAKAGTVGGALAVSGCSIFCTDGFTVVGGPFRGFSNEFRKGTSGYTFAPLSQCGAVVGPDLFESGVSYSYDVPTDSASLAVNVMYDGSTDGSVNKFRNVSNRVSIKAAAPKLITVSDATYTINKQDTGNIIAATGGAAQTFTLPTGIPGTEFNVRKLSSQPLTVSRPSGTTLRTGTGVSKDTLSAAAGDQGGSVVLLGQSGPVYILGSKTGIWTEA